MTQCIPRVPWKGTLEEDCTTQRGLVLASQEQECDADNDDWPRTEQHITQSAESSHCILLLSHTHTVLMAIFQQNLGFPVSHLTMRGEMPFFTPNHQCQTTEVLMDVIFTGNRIHDLRPTQPTNSIIALQEENSWWPAQLLKLNNEWLYYINKATHTLILRAIFQAKPVTPW